ncbi:MAG: UDP-N-acetylglucosamine 2-epimerase (non-hydrolyzing) [Deltaproteobacteria bacterium]|nr:UDP-N-acetylglucosamine 2-epimerase (non-hydrolyzing) [Deltaproteobacteria bacterium]
MTAPVLHVVGARPNFMKMAPLLEALARDPGGREHLLVHTGQHYDEHLNDAIFRDLGLRAPDVHLGVGSGSHAEQTARVMLAFERLVAERRPGLVVVAGDVNSTLSCCVVAAKACVPVAHLEAGLRSRDRTMPEEVNRIVTDRLTDLFLTPSPDADANLLAEGVAPSAIVRVGNCMIDSVQKHLPAARQSPVLARLGVERRGFFLLTLHRPSNVDEPERLARLVETLCELARRAPVIFPVHPRTRARLASLGLSFESLATARVHVLEPLGYLEFLALEDAASLVITDSGGVQEETTALGVPCLTVRDNTERPITVEVGTNTLVGSEPSALPPAVDAVLAGHGKRGQVPEGWDGHAGERAAAAIRTFLEIPRPGAAR